jgi:predicted O-linked N-acetylglucosamine transferase (SPINDLY family)
MNADSAALRQAKRLYHEGRTAQAEAVLVRALQKTPADPALNEAMANLLLLRGEAARAVYFAERLLKARPGSADAMMLLASTLTSSGQRAKGEDLVRRALATDPAHLGARLTEVQWLYGDFRLHEMVAKCREGLALAPNHPELSINLSNALLMMGRGDDAADVLERALAANPGNHNLTTALCAAINYSVSATPARVFEVHVNYGKTLAAMMLPRVRRPDPPAPLDPERRLRVGIQSPDLRTHPVATFLSAFLPHMDRSRFELVAYYTELVEDDTTRRLKPMFDEWCHFRGLREEDMAARIASDRIDIVIELDGHFATHRLPSLHMKPAPVQMTYLGYPNTTGVPAIDYRLVDSLTDPAPGADALAVERLIRLDPCFLCYRPPEGAPAVNPVPPSQRDDRPSGPGGGPGRITFGSFNSLQKINDRLIAVWRRVVEAVEGSSLVLKTQALRHAELRQITAERFAAAGFPMDRLTLLPPAPTPAAHLATYDGIDIALDAFPYCGTTTTCEALLMGVPVVSLASPPQPLGLHAGRVGLSLLTNAGAGDLVAHSADEYVAKAAALAADRARLAELRRTSRERLLASPLCDAPAFARRFGAALREAWRRHCGAGGEAGPAAGEHAGGAGAGGGPP